MKELFPGYYRKTENDIKKMWEHGILMFDANVLLNLYRYSDSTQNTIIELIKKFSKHIYLPHQAALEYNRNRYEVITEQEKAYKEFLQKITQIQTDLQSTSKPPFLSSKVDKELNVIFVKVGDEVKESINKYCDYLKNDPIYNTISELFSNRITEQFSDEKLKEIFIEGEDRYKNRVPPGFEDEKTKDGINKFGDLVLWKQIIQKAKELKKDVILITDERKIDWWWKIKDGRNMGPRQELVEEIKIQANVDFYMYSSERFLKYGQSFLKEKINQHALEEIQAMKKAEFEDNKRIQFLKKVVYEGDLKVKEEMNSISKRIDYLNNTLFNISKIKEDLFKESIESLNNEKLHSMSLYEADLNEEKRDLFNRLNAIQNLLKESETESKDGKMLYLHYLNELKHRND